MKGNSLDLARRAYLLRIMGLGLGALAMAAVLWEGATAWWLWGLLLLHGFIWPHLAFLRTLLRRSALRAERQHLLADALLGAAWLPLIGFNALPSVLVWVLLAANLLVAGGPVLLAKAVAGQLLVVGAMLLAGVGHWQWQTSAFELLGCLPLLLCYPLLWALLSYLGADKAGNGELAIECSPASIYPMSDWERLVEQRFLQCQGDLAAASIILLDMSQARRRRGEQWSSTQMRQLANILALQMRGGDKLGLWGNKGLGLLLPGTRLDAAVVIAERIRQQLTELSRDQGQLGLCAGVAGFSPAQRDHHGWLAQAELRLSKAKEAGRNRVVAA